MTEMGKAMMGTGEAEGASRALDAAEAAISNPLLDDVSMRGARGVLINITGGPDMTLFEVDETANRIRDEVDPEANIIFGSTFDQNLEGRIRVSVVATGIEADEAVQPRPAALSLVSALAGQDIPQPEAAAEAQAVTAAAAPTAPAEAPAMPAQAQARNSLYAYSQAAVLGTAPEPAAKTSTAVAESMTAETLAVGTSRVAVAPEAAPEVAPEVAMAPATEPTPQNETFVEVMETPATDSFIAPLPVEPELAPEPEIRAPVQAQADPFATAAARTAQPHLSGFEPARPNSAGPVDEELLDIPAFLRRQAN
jgi:cell division protein FtsZ